MEGLPIILFFVYTFGFGFSATYFLKNSSNFFERNLMRIGVGLGIMPVLIVLLDFLHIPIDWKIFFVLSLIIPFYSLIKKEKPNIRLRLTKSNLYLLIILVIFISTFFMYHKGAFAYPWLEDDDPWEHAFGAEYVSIQRIAHNPSPEIHTAFMDPYPPAYDALMGILHQTSKSINWTLKFFNALIISLGIIFFYFFVKRFIGNKNKALFATFILAAIPCYLSHFIWAHALVVTMFFPAMYSIEMIRKDKKWAYILCLITAGIIVTQPTQAIKFMVLVFICFLIKSIYEKRFVKEILLAQIGGLAISMLWWYKRIIPMFAKELWYTKDTVAGGSGFNIFSLIHRVFPPSSGSATRVYSFGDFFYAKAQNMINNPIGIGIFISLLAAIAIIFILIRYKSLFKKENSWIAITLLWFLFTFLGVNSMTFHLPVGLYAFRFWMLLAIPVSILASYGTFKITALFKRYKPVIFIIFVILIAGILLTSAYQKYTVNTVQWSPGQAFVSSDELVGYLWLKENLPIDTKVYSACQPTQSIITGMDKMPVFDVDVFSYNARFINESTDNIRIWMNKKGYEYFVIDGYCVNYFGINKTNSKLNELTKEFNAVYSTAGAVIFKV